MIKDLIRKNRSYRRFDESFEINRNEILELIDLARLSPSARNAQPLKYMICCDEKSNEEIFPLVAWAGYLKDWDGPVKGERPTAYIVVLKDTNIAKNHFCDDGIAMQSILLGAVEKGLGGCIMGAIKREQIRILKSIPEHLDILYVIALGKPVEEVVVDEVKDDDIKYWRSEDEVHHVPKRKLGDIIIE
ncbi:nitroreductase family protein [Puteibacter caeruleilacunae]|nr:nitroreductase family protein [Puteibacter caeruleilacunae]